MTREDYLKALLSVTEQSKTMQTWALSIIGGSILAILGTSYVRPVSRKIRWVYFIFIAGWSYLIASLYSGHQISRQYVSALFIKDALLPGVEDKMGEAFVHQINYFETGLSAFAIWLLIYLVWWVLGNWENPQKTK